MLMSELANNSFLVFLEPLTDPYSSSLSLYSSSSSSSWAVLEPLLVVPPTLWEALRRLRDGEVLRLFATRDVGREED